MITSAPLTKLYNKYNLLLFDNKLPKVTIRIDETLPQPTSDGGMLLAYTMNKRRIYFAKSISRYSFLRLGWSKLTRTLLIHEMIHVYLFTVGSSSNHTKAFFRLYKSKLLEAGLKPLRDVEWYSKSAKAVLKEK